MFTLVTVRTKLYAFCKLTLSSSLFAISGHGSGVELLLGHHACGALKAKLISKKSWTDRQTTRLKSKLQSLLKPWLWSFISIVVDFGKHKHANTLRFWIGLLQVENPSGCFFASHSVQVSSGNDTYVGNILLPSCSSQHRQSSCCRCASRLFFVRKSLWKIVAKYVMHVKFVGVD